MSDCGDISGLVGQEDIGVVSRAGGMKLSRGGRKNAGRGGGEYTPLRSIRDDSLRLSSGSIIGLCIHGFQAAVLGGSSEVVLVGDNISVLPAFFLRAFHASIAFARQLLLAFAREAAASESFSFSAYPHILGPGNTCVLVFGLSIDGTVDGEEGADSNERDREGSGVKGVSGDGGTSIALWFVIPRHTLLASRDVIPDELSVSVSLPSSCVSSSSLVASSSLTEEGN